MGGSEKPDMVAKVWGGEWVERYEYAAHQIVDGARRKSGSLAAVAPHTSLL
jgi:hypothetical protein